jgi:hypothetical protein
MSQRRPLAVQLQMHPQRLQQQEQLRQRLWQRLWQQQQAPVLLRQYRMCQSAQWTFFEH